MQTSVDKLLRNYRIGYAEYDAFAQVIRNKYPSTFCAGGANLFVSTYDILFMITDYHEYRQLVFSAYYLVRASLSLKQVHGFVNELNQEKAGHYSFEAERSLLEVREELSYRGGIFAAQLGDMAEKFARDVPENVSTVREDLCLDPCTLAASQVGDRIWVVEQTDEATDLLIDEFFLTWEE